MIHAINVHENQIKLDILQLLKLTLPVTTDLSTKIKALMVAAKPCWAASVRERAGWEALIVTNFPLVFMRVRLVSPHMACPYTTGFC